MKRFPSAENIDRIAEALNIAPSDLFVDVNNSEVIKSKAKQQKCKSLLKTKILEAIEEAF
jgi:transcriptional regulator with XRE-family HTH domain